MRENQGCLLRKFGGDFVEARVNTVARLGRNKVGMQLICFGELRVLVQVDGTHVGQIAYRKKDKTIYAGVPMQMEKSPLLFPTRTKRGSADFWQLMRTIDSQSSRF